MSHFTNIRKMGHFCQSECVRLRSKYWRKYILIISKHMYWFSQKYSRLKCLYTVLFLITSKGIWIQNLIKNTNMDVRKQTSPPTLLPNLDKPEPKGNGTRTEYSYGVFRHSENRNVPTWRHSLIKQIVVKRRCCNKRH